MKPSDFIYKQAYSSILKIGASPSIAAQYSAMAVDAYNKNSYKGKPLQVIADAVSMARKVMVK